MYTSARLVCKYLNWLNVPTKIFNAGEYRRQLLGPGQKAEFWDVNNADGWKQRQEILMIALTDLINWLTLSNDDSPHSQKCGIFDATNTTRERRSFIIEKLRDGELKIPENRIIFIESKCDDIGVINANIREIKIKSSDYQNVYNKEDAVTDFVNRIKQYERVYEPLDDSNDMDKALSFITMIDVGRKFVMNRIGGYIPGRITSLLMNMHIGTRIIWLTRHGESQDNLKNKLGGDSPLSERGQCYANVLFEFVKEKMQENKLVKDDSSEEENYPLDGLNVWTSTLKRTRQTAAPLKKICSVMRWKALDEIDAGMCEGMTYEEIKEQMPNEYKSREQDKFRYRYPRGESYLDMVYRIEPVIMELERQRNPVLIIGHQAVNRVLYAYLTGYKPEECSNIPIPLHVVIQIVPNAYGYTAKYFDLNDRVEEEYNRRKLDGQ